MTYANPEALVSTEALAGQLSAPDLRVVDATWFMKMQGRDARQEYQAEHIPGAVFFDIDEIADTGNPLPHMLPPPEKFSSKVRRLGLGNGNRIVVYDNNGGAASARVWWMFRLFGHKDVSVLDGGFAKWKVEGRPVEDLPPMPRERHFMSRINTFLVRDAEQLKANIASGREQVIDARSPGRFAGTDPEPWPVAKSGHIPGSVNVPYLDLLNGDKTFRNGPELAARFAQAGIDLGKPVVTSCGSGVTACIVALALHLIGHDQVAVYDGSWAEWGSRDDTPVEQG